MLLKGIRLSQTIPNANSVSIDVVGEIICIFIMIIFKKKIRKLVTFYKFNKNLKNNNSKFLMNTIFLIKGGNQHCNTKQIRRM